MPPAGGPQTHVSPAGEQREIADLRAAVLGLRDQLDRTLDGVEFIKSRMSSYIGNGVAITFMPDERPIYVNSLDFGGPANLINGGRYEVDNLDVLLSFVKPDTVFLDIGANLGFFSLQVAPRLTSGRVIAFEPHPKLVQLFRASAYINGLSDFYGTAGKVVCHQMGVGEADTTMPFLYPEGHLGGGFSAPHSAEAQVHAPIRSLDTFLPADFTCDLIKIDVEGGELAALSGMRGILERSPSVKILLEKLPINGPYDAGLAQLLTEMGFSLFAVGASAVLQPLAVENLGGFSGYVLAARPGVVTDLNRAQIELTEPQLAHGLHTASDGAGWVSAAPGETLLYGPYWELRAGRYRLHVDAQVRGGCEMLLLGHQARQLQVFDLQPEMTTVDFTLPRNVPNFECVVRAKGEGAGIRLRRIVIEHI